MWALVETLHQLTLVVVGVQGTDPVLRTIHVLLSVIPAATQLLSG